MHMATQDKQPWDDLKKATDFKEHACHTTMGRNRWAVVEFFGSTRREDVYAMLRLLDCDLVAVGTSPEKA